MSQILAYCATRNATFGTVIGLTDVNIL